MLSDERLSTRSLANSRADSYQDKAPPGIYQRPSSISEQGENYNEYEIKDDADEQTQINRPPPRTEDPYVAALRHRFPNRPKSDYAYSRPSALSIPSQSAPMSSNMERTKTANSTQSTAVQTTADTPSPSGRYQSSIRPNTSGTVSVGTSDDPGFLRPALRRVTPEQQNTYARRLSIQTEPTATKTTTGTSTMDGKPMTSTGMNVRITEPDIQTNGPASTTFARQTSTVQPNESIFEKVHAPSGQLSYLGIGTFSQFEQCLRECLERERRQLGAASQITRHVIPAGVSAYDYSYDSVMGSVPSHIVSANSSSHIIDYPSRSAATFLLDDIHHINVALSRSGTPIFPYQGSYPNSYPVPWHNITVTSSYPTGQYATGEVVSACRVAEEDTAITDSGVFM